MLDLLELNQQVYSFLEEMRKEYTDLFYTLRITQPEKIAEGYIFNGNSDAIFFSFWFGKDRVAQAARISLRIDTKGELSIWLNSNDNEEINKFFKLLGIMLGNFTKFHKSKGSYLRRYKTTAWQDGLKSFIKNDLKKINRYIAVADVNVDIFPVDAETFKQNIDLQKSIKIFHNAEKQIKDGTHR